MKSSFLRTNFFLIAADLILYYGAFGAAIFLRFGTVFDYPYILDHLFHFSLLSIPFLLIFFSFRLYEYSVISSGGYFLKYSLSAFCFFGVISVVYFYALSSQLISPKIILIYFFAALGGLWYGFRIFHRLIVLNSYFKERIALIEGDETSFTFIDDIQDAGVPVNVLCECHAAKDGYVSQDALSQFRECVLRERVQTIVASPKIFAEERNIEYVAGIIPFSVQFLDLPGAYERFLHKIPLDAVDAAWFLRHISKPIEHWHEGMKRITDVIIGVLGIVLFMMAYPLIFLFVKIEDRGPIFFKQQRMGKGNRVFTLYKFRTMRWKVQDQSPLWTEPNDLRQTFVGKFIRRFHIDEIPQAINILKGDMSFVGPRAERIELAAMYEKEIPFYAMRHLVRPGVTGWAQLYFPASASVKEAREKLQYDLFYVKNRSFFLDLQIIFKTVTVICFKHV